MICIKDAKLKIDEEYAFQQLVRHHCQQRLLKRLIVHKAELPVVRN